MSTPKVGPEGVKFLIELASTEEEADAYVEKYFGFRDYKSKNAYLTGAFSNVQILAYTDPDGENEENREHDDYFAKLHAIISLKWRRS